MMKSIGDYMVEKAPPTVYYIPDFISETEETYLIEKVMNAPKPKWKQLSHRRLQNWGGVLGKKGLIVDSELPSWLQSCIDKICQLPDCKLFPQTNRPNHVLINEYLAGQGIMPHVDGPMYFPVIATINLGGHIVLDMYERSNSTDESTKGTSDEGGGESSSMMEPSVDRGRTPIGSLLLERRSLVLITDDLYTNYLHGIADRSQDSLDDRVWNLDRCPGRCVGDTIDRTSTRISLTIRNIPKVTYLTNRK